MTLIEMIGFIIVFIAMVALYLKRSWDERMRRKYPEKFEEEEREEQQQLKELLRSLNLEQASEQETEAIANSELHLKTESFKEILELPSRDEFAEQMSKERYVMKGMQRKLFHNPGEKQAYKLKEKGKQKEILGLLGKNPQSAIVLKEILDKPKGY